MFHFQCLVDCELDWYELAQLASIEVTGASPMTLSLITSFHFVKSSWLGLISLNFINITELIEPEI